MENFKEIAEKCLAGELSGTFIIDKGLNWHSSYLRRHHVIGRQMPGQYVLGPGIIYNEIGQCENREKVKIIDFIPDNVQEQIKIDIPEGMKAVQETVNGEIRIKFVEEKLTYENILERMNPELCILPFSTPDSNVVNDTFFDKVNTLRKLTNIRNYFGKPTGDIGYTVIQSGPTQAATNYRYLPVFAKKEHAEQAIKMLGDELKYLFEPW